jgi:hypothetical protein
MAVSRRTLLKLAAAGLALPAPLLAGGDAAGRRFLFVFARGGWDTTFVFAPLFGNANVDMEADATASEAHGIPFVDAANRPSVRTFFETWGGSTCVLNGFEVRSIAHEKARRLLFTGTPGDADDWGSVLATAAGDDLAMPFVVADGPSYTRDLAANVVRLGTAGQFGGLLDGTALDHADLFPNLSGSATAAVDAAVARRVLAADAAAGRGRATRWTGDYADALTRLDHIRAMQDRLSLSTDDDFSAKAAGLLTCFELGLARVGLVQHNGFHDLSWDTHANIDQQATHYEDLFGALNILLADLATRPGPAGGTLLDEVTVVVVSEMGRHPRLNAFDGKDHWTFTSAMLVGAGVAGGRAIGGWDADVVGETVDLASGETTPGGTQLTSQHLGATLLALGDVDPTPYCGGAEPVTAILA